MIGTSLAARSIGDQRQSVDVGEAEVEQHDVAAALQRDARARQPGPGDRDRVAAVGEAALHGRADRRVVLHDQDAAHEGNVAALPVHPLRRSCGRGWRMRP